MRRPAVADETRRDGSGTDQVEVKPKDDRRHRYEAKQVAAGFTRCIVRCHVDDVAEIKAYAATLLRKRARTS